MSEPKSSWSFVGISPEARQAAEEAAEVSGMELNTWLTQLIKYTSAMELREGGRPTSLDELIRRETGPGGRAAPQFTQAEAPQSDRREPVLERTFPGVDPMAGAAKETDTIETPERDTGGETQSVGPRDERNRPGRPASTQPDRPAETMRGEDGELLPTIATEALRPSRLSALNETDENAIRDALDDWRDSGDFRPLTVRPRANEPGLYEIVVGIARWHAARRAHIRELPVILREMNDEEALTHGLAARLKEGPVSALTEASIYLRLMTEASQSTEQVGRLVGKPPAHVATMVRILNLPKAVREMLENGEITVLHARALLDAPNPEAIARDVVRRRLDIYQTEQLVRIASRNAQLVEAEDIERPEDEITEDGSWPPATADISRRAGRTTATPSFDRPSHPWHDEDTDPASVRGRGGSTRLDTVDRPVPRGDGTGDEGPDRGRLPSYPKPGSARPGHRVNPTGSSRDLRSGTMEEESGPEQSDRPGDDPASLRIPPPRPRGPAGRSGYGSDFALEPPGPARRGRDPEPPVFPNDLRAEPDAPQDSVVTTDLLERHLSRLLGLKVAISEHGSMGLVTVHYSSREQLSDLIARLNSASNV